MNMKYSKRFILGTLIIILITIIIVVFGIFLILKNNKSSQQIDLNSNVTNQEEEEPRTIELQTPRASVALIKDIRASSELEAQTYQGELRTYDAKNAIDGDITTAWFEGVDGFGKDEYLEIEFAKTVELDSFFIFAGYNADLDRFERNNRLAKILIELDNFETEIELKDVFGPQKIDLQETKLTNKLKIIIKDVYAGIDNDSPISEISFSEVRNLTTAQGQKTICKSEVLGFETEIPGNWHCLLYKSGNLEITNGQLSIFQVPYSSIQYLDNEKQENVGTKILNLDNDKQYTFSFPDDSEKFFNIVSNFTTDYGFSEISNANLLFSESSTGKSQMYTIIDFNVTKLEGFLINELEDILNSIRDIDYQEKNYSAEFFELDKCENQTLTTQNPYQTGLKVYNENIAYPPSNLYLNGTWITKDDPATFNYASGHNFIDASFSKDCKSIFITKQYNFTTGAGFAEEILRYDVSSKNFKTTDFEFVLISNNKEYGIFTKGDYANRSTFWVFEDGSSNQITARQQKLNNTEYANHMIRAYISPLAQAPFISDDGLIFYIGWVEDDNKQNEYLLRYDIKTDKLEILENRVDHSQNQTLEEYLRAKTYI